MAFKRPRWGGSDQGGGWGDQRGGTRWGGGVSNQSWWRRTFLQGDNPMTWSAPIGHVFGITVRVSLIYIIWMLIQLTAAGEVGWPFKLWSLASLFVLVLMHEFGHCFACRSVRGEADEILMWMLGGLASCRPPHNWKAALVTTIGGPGVNVVLVPILMGVMLSLGVPLKALIFNPFSSIGEPWYLALDAMLHHVPSWLAYGLFTFYVSNATLLLFNIFLPFYPFDGGRIVQEVLWWRIGYTRSMWIATTVGFFGALGLAAFGLYTMGRGSSSGFNLVLIGAFGAITCWQQRQQLRFIGESAMTEERWSQWGADGESWKQGKGGWGGSVPGGAIDATADHGASKKAEKAAKAAEAARKQAEDDNAELDRILAKIKDKGMASLSRTEQAFLRRSSERSRGG